MHPTAELFTEKAWAAIVAAQQLAQQKRQQQMESEHLLSALLAQQGLASRILEKAGVEVGSLSQKVDAYIAAQASLSSPPDNVYLGKGLDQVLNQADALRKTYEDSYIAIEHLVLALAIDDRCAKQLFSQAGTNADKLKDAVRQSVQQGHNQASRQRLKRQLLDNLDKMHQFEPPQSLVEDEFNNVWKQVQDDLKSQARTFADEGTTEEAAREEYRKIAERRVRLGLVVAEIGERNKIQVSDEEVNRAVVERLRQFPGQEREVYEFYKKNPQALASIRAPIFEEKVVDFVSELGQVTEKKVSRAEIEKAEEEDSAKALADAKS